MEDFELLRFLHLGFFPRRQRVGPNVIGGIAQPWLRIIPGCQRNGQRHREREGRCERKFFSATPHIQTSSERHLDDSRVRAGFRHAL
jgi:hypothetical protein